MKTIFLVLCFCLTAVTCAAQVNTQRAADERLVSCVEAGDAGCVARALADGASPNATTKDGGPVLTLAAGGKSASVVKLLVSAGADVNDTQRDEATALCAAATFGSVEVIETLLGAGAKVNAVCGGHGDTPLMKTLLGAMMLGIPPELKEAAGVVTGDEAELTDDDKTLLRVLTTPRADFIAAARLLLARGADVNVVAACDVGETALMYAAWGADAEMVKELLARGAKVDTGVNALAWLLEIERDAAQTQRPDLPAYSKEQTAALGWLERTRTAREEVKQLLRAAGAKEPEKGSGEGDQEEDESLAEAADEAFTETIKRNDVKDLERLADAYRGHPLGASALADALRTAVIYDRPEMVRLLLARGADPNNGSIYTALMDAAKEGRAEYVRMLLDAGAEVNASDGEGQTALDYAESWGGDEKHDAVIEILKSRGAKSGKPK